MTAAEILQYALEIQITKGRDYTSDPTVDPHENFERSALVASWFHHDIDKAYAVLVATKLARLATLLNNGGTPNHEALVDTFMDAANYCALWGGRRT